MAIGPDAISWEELVDDITPLIENLDYKGKLVLSVSSCGSGSNTLSRCICRVHGDEGNRLPAYIFSIMGDTINWDDSLIAWNLLYLKLSQVGLTNRDKVIQSLNEVLAGTGVKFSYSRWSDEDEKYLRWPRSE